MLVLHVVDARAGRGDVVSRVRREPSRMPEQDNPTQLKSAVLFGVMYAAVLMALAVAKHYWHGQGLYAVAVSLPA